MTNDGRNTYSYDAENRVISMTAIGGGTTTYGYDAFGSRVQKVTGATTVRYYFGLGLEEVKKKAREIANKKNCNEFLNSIFRYAAAHGQEVNSANANLDDLLSILESADYKVQSKGLRTDYGTDVSEYFRTHPDTQAFVQQGSGTVYLRSEFSGTTLVQTMLHEAFHILVKSAATSVVTQFQNNGAKTGPLIDIRGSDSCKLRHYRHF